MWPGIWNLIQLLERIEDEAVELARATRVALCAAHGMSSPPTLDEIGELSDLTQAAMHEMVDVLGWIQVGMAQLPPAQQGIFFIAIKLAVQEHWAKCKKRGLPPITATYQLLMTVAAAGGIQDPDDTLGAGVQEVRP